jgi:hypothetical protein
MSHTHLMLRETAFGRSFVWPCGLLHKLLGEIAIAHRQSNLSGVCLAMDASQQYDSVTIAILRRALDDVLTDPRFLNRRSTSALEIAEHLLAQAAIGERDLDRLKASAFNKLVSQ